MFNFGNSKNSKKGILALETILSLIISIFVLFFIFQIFYNAFLKVPTNLKIAEDNAKSIVEFVDYSFNKYKSSNDCYTILKLKNLENYQYKDKDGKNYFYIIDSKGVKVYSKDSFDTILNDINKFDMNSYIKKYDFKSNIKKIVKEDLPLNLYNYNIALSVFNFLNFFTIIGILDPITGYMQNLKDFYQEVKLVNSNIIIMYPVFGKYFFDKDIGSDLISNNKNILYALNYERLNENGGILNTISNKILNKINYESYYLTYKPNNKVFPLYTMDSENFIKKNLCEYKNFLNNFQKQFFSNKLNYFNDIQKNKYILISDNSGNKYKLVSRNKEKICYKNSNKFNCFDLFNENVDSLSYLNFISKIQKLSNRKKGELGDIKYEDKTEKQFVSDLLVENRDHITLNNIENDKLPSKYEVYILKRNNYVKSILDFFNLGSNNLNNNNYLNNCNQKICNYILYDKNTKLTYFYDDKYFNNFVNFNTNFLEKEKYGSNYKIYFNNNNYEANSGSLVANKWKAQKEFYFLNIKTKNDKKISFLFDQFIMGKIFPLNYNKK